MKRIILLLSIVPCLYSFTDVEQPNNSLTQENLKGKVRFVAEATYYPAKKYRDYRKGIRSWQSTDNYNENGYKTETNKFDSEGSLDRKSTFKYDKNGNETEENRYHADGMLAFKNVYTYDENGNKTIDWSQSYHTVNSLRCRVSSLKKKDENIRVQPAFSGRKQLQNAL